jgi:hypothetical protein
VSKGLAMIVLPLACEKHSYVTDIPPSNALDIKSSEGMTSTFMVYTGCGRNSEAF